MRIGLEHKGLMRWTDDLPDAPIEHLIIVAWLCKFSGLRFLIKQ
jgi:hypothetical protein